MTSRASSDGFSPVSLLSRSLSVESVGDGLVAVTVHLPADLVSEYCGFLQSLAGFFQVFDRHVTRALSAPPAAESLAVDEEIEQRIAIYRALCLDQYHKALSAGFDHNAAIHEVSRVLRKANHPWSTRHVVAKEINQALGRRSGRACRGPR